MRLTRRYFLTRLGLSAAGLTVLSRFTTKVWAVEGPASRGGRTDLPRSTPQSQGVSCGPIIEFLDAVARARHELHSFMMLKAGSVVAEGWWTPYRSGVPHPLYSLGKIWLSSAIGLAIAERRFSLDTPVIDFFPRQIPSRPADHLGAMTVQHLLTGTTGQTQHDLKRMLGRMFTPEEFVASFLAMPIASQPGTEFAYNSATSLMLSAIIEKVTGVSLVEYLRARLFEPLGIEPLVWELNGATYPNIARTEDLAKLGQLNLQKGSWHGTQVLPSQWVKAATSEQVSTASWPGGAALGPDWQQGYGYQFWRCRYDVYRGDGAFGQLCVVVPQHDAVIVVTSEVTNIQGLLDLIWTHLLPACVPSAPKAGLRTKLKERLAAAALPVPFGVATSPIAQEIAGKVYTLHENPLGAKTVSLQFEEGACTLRLEHERGASLIRSGIGYWLDGATDMPGAPSKLLVTGAPAPSLTKVAAAGAWKGERIFEIRWQFYETAHHQVLTCEFDRQRLRIDLRNSIGGLANSILLEGELRTAA